MFPAQLAVFQYLVASVLLTPPALGVFDAGYRFMGGFDVKTLIRFDDFQRIRMHPVDDQVQMQIIGVGMKSIDGLMVFQSQFIEK